MKLLPPQFAQAPLGPVTQTAPVRTDQHTYRDPLMRERRTASRIEMFPSLRAPVEEGDF